VNAGLVRRGLHGAHAAAALVLLASGVLLGAPDLRARVLGGYGREVAAWHDAGACLLLAAPVVALGLVAPPLARDLRRRLGPPDGLTWRKLHVALSLAISALLSASGVVLWIGAAAPPSVYDRALQAHVAASWALGLTIPVHVVAVRRKLAARARGMLRGGPEGPPFEPEPEPDE
jgi:cytochrome b subunit of formate dehydrogenase